jgi:ribonuclease P protein component
LKAVDFNRVFEQNAASNDGCFRLIARPSKASVHRVGMAISRKVHRNAVERNRIKRIIRESFRHWRASSAAETGHPLDIVVLARPTAAHRDNPHLFKSLERHWSTLASRVSERFSGTTFSEEP